MFKAIHEIPDFGLKMVKFGPNLSLVKKNRGTASASAHTKVVGFDFEAFHSLGVLVGGVPEHTNHGKPRKCPVWRSC